MNYVHLLGRITKDATIRYTTDKKYNKVEFTLAVTSGYGDKAKTNFIPCEKWSAEKLQRYLTKGTQVAVVGRLDIDRYEDKNGNKKNFTKVTVSEITLLGTKKDMEIPPGFEAIDDDGVPF